MKIKILLASLLFSISTFVVAENTEENSFYLQYDMGGSDKGIAARALIGIDLNKYLAVELSTFGSAAIFGKDFDINSLILAAKWDLSDDNSLGFKVGASRWSSEDFGFFSPVPNEKSGNDIMVGMTFIYNFNRHSSAVITAEKYLDIDLSPVTVGYRYTF